MPSNITKDFVKVCNAFLAGTAIEGGKISFSGYGNGPRCHTNGGEFYSYGMLIAKRFKDNAGKVSYYVIAREYGPSATTKRHITALMLSLPDPAVVREGCLIAHQFKFNASY